MREEDCLLDKGSLAIGKGGKERGERKVACGHSIVRDGVAEGREVWKAFISPRKGIRLYVFGQFQRGRSYEEKRNHQSMKFQREKTTIIKSKG